MIRLRRKGNEQYYPVYIIVIINKCIGVVDYNVSSAKRCAISLMVCGINNLGGFLWYGGEILA